ncbi:VQ motif-containing protein [Corchorus capsularis]|uniref:VQ motif-containing protein n=1 Tax=Corchorus capsularis TaxID=210143 RepID=A0A1R3J6E6_COCAP|nr:VQ motif-containing protein [Corchorus capsularis]
MEKPASPAATSGKPLTTFVQTDSNTFREVVQRLTGPSEDAVQEGAATKVPGLRSPHFAYIDIRAFPTRDQKLKYPFVQIASDNHPELRT